MVEDLPVITPAACADYYGSLIYSGIMCIDAAGGKGVCNVSPTSVSSQVLYYKLLVYIVHYDKILT